MIFKITDGETTVLDVGDQTVDLDLEVNQQGGYIHKKAYYYVGGKWNLFHFNGDFATGSNWIRDIATASLSIDATDSLVNGLNPILAYSCKKYDHVGDVDVIIMRAVILINGCCNYSMFLVLEFQQLLLAMLVGVCL